MKRVRIGIKLFCVRIDELSNMDVSKMFLRLSVLVMLVIVNYKVTARVPACKYYIYFYLFEKVLRLLIY